MNTKNTRRSLLASALALVLCVSMLIGSTFAWFTDSVVSGNNVIAAGNLDVDLYHSDKNDSGYVNSGTTLFNDVTRWEPGVVVYENFRVENVGNLALNYRLTINATPVGEKDLTNILKVAVVDGGFSGDREAAHKLAEEGKMTSLSTFILSGELEGNEKSNTYGVVIYWEPGADDNEYNMNNGDQGKILSVDLGVNLVATQEMYESDSFGSDYDGLASDWDGSTGEVPTEENGVITITTGAELAALAESVNNGNTYRNKTVKLGADIDLGGKNWTPIGQNGDNAGFQGTFDGQGRTIYNLYVNQTSRAYQAAGLFGSTRYATIKNFKIVNATINNLDDSSDSSNGAAVVVGAAQFATTIDNVDVENANVTGNRRVAAIAGYYVGTITNCDVKNVNLTAKFDALSGGSYDNADKVGMIIAYSNGASTISNNTVTGGSINGYRDMGGIAGYATTSTLTDNKVSGLSIIVNNAHNYKGYADLDAHDAGQIIGEGTADATNVATNVTIEMPVANTADLEAAINAGETEIELAAGSYVLPGVTGKDITLVGVGPETVVDYSNMGGYQEVSGSSFVFKNMTVVNAETGYPYPGLQHITSVSYEDCHIVGTVNLFAPATFTNCTFDSKSAEHNVVTYGSDSVTFTKCKFTYGDRSVNCYAENASSRNVVVTFTDCEFTKVAGKDAVGAIETNSSFMNSLTLTINGCTVNEGQMVYVSEYDSAAGAKSSITVDGEEVYVVAVGNMWANAETDAAVLKAALAADKKNISVILLEDVSVDIGTGWKMGGANTESITIDGNGKVVTLSSTYRSYFNMANNNGVLNLKNMTMTNLHKGAHFFDYTTHFNCDVVAEKVVFAKSPLVASGAEAVFNECEFSQAGTDIYGLWIMSGSNVTVNGGELKTDRGFKIADEDSAQEETILNVSGTKFNNTKKAAILVTTNYGAKITLSNLDITNCSADNTNAVWIDDGRTATADKIVVTGGSVVVEP